MSNTRVFSEFERNKYDVHPLVEILQGGKPKSVNFEQIGSDTCADDSRLEKLTYLDSADGGYIDTEPYVTELLSAREEIKQIDLHKLIQEAMHSFSTVESTKFTKDIATVKRYLEAFFGISKNVVFSEKNANLYYSAFRNSDFLKELVEMSAVKKPEEEDSFYLFSFKNPISLYALSRILSNLKRFEKEELGENGPIYELRKSIFMDTVMSAFKRYFYVDGKTYRVNLSRHYQYLSAFPYEDLSSIEEIKPIRLLEKVASYVRNEMGKVPSNKELYVAIAIIGHTEPSQDQRQRGLIDFVASVLNWYSKLDAVDNPPRLHLNVTNYVSEKDWPPRTKNDNARNLHGEIKWDGHSANYDIERVSTNDYFGFNTKNIERIIENNHIIFLLDCPWLSTENYQLAEDMLLETFCEQLKNKDIIDEMDRNDHFVDNVHSIYEDTTFDNLGVQYNRIMATATMRSGKIVRTMREPLIKRIDDLFVKNAQKSGDGRRRLLYFFSSAKEGIIYSRLYSSVRARQEKYDGRTHLIVELDTANPNQLTLRKMNPGEKHCFHINLWSILKYISASYAYTGFENHVRSILGEINEKMAIDFLELYRNICADFELSPNLRVIRIRVILKQGLDKCIQELAKYADVKEAKKKIHGLVCELLEPLYCQAVFGGNKRYGDDAIKTAFRMNLYSCADDVHLMLFLHNYSVHSAKNELDSVYTVTFSHDYFELTDVENMSYVDDLKNKDHFMDRRLYEFILNYLEKGSNLSLPLRSMFYEADKRTGWRDSLNRVLNNIISACEGAGETNTLLYRTALKIQREE